MRTRITVPVTVAALAISACGGGGDAQSQVADLMVEAAEAEGLALDRDCVGDLAGQLSDDDAQKLIDAGVDGDPDVSAEADAIGEQMIGCLDTDSLVDQLVAEMGGEGVDADCLKAVLEEGGIEAMEGTAMLECFEISMDG